LNTNIRKDPIINETQVQKIVRKEWAVGLQTPRLKLREKKESTLRKKRKYCMSE
jgi:hypothetical protein